MYTVYFKKQILVNSHYFLRDLKLFLTYFDKRRKNDFYALTLNNCSFQKQGSINIAVANRETFHGAIHLLLHLKVKGSWETGYTKTHRLKCSKLDASECQFDVKYLSSTLQIEIIRFIFSNKG